MNIAFFETAATERDEITKALAGHTVKFYDGTLTKENVGLVADAEVVSIFINSEISADIVAALPATKFITTRSTGFDHIDLAATKAKGIVVANVPGYGSHTVAEYAFALMLGLSRKLFPARARLRDEKSFSIAGLEGFDLMGKTLGVLGTGRIGKNAIVIAKAFGMNVIAYDVFHDDAFAQKTGFPYVDLPTILAQSDILTFHLPYNEGTHHILNGTNIALVKKGAYLINTARGELIDTKAMLAALADGTLAGAGLDVLEAERSAKAGASSEIVTDDMTLAGLPNVIVTPHVAFYTQEAVAEINKTTIGNIVSFVGGTPQNVVS
jgi:D-lactate dehydrogenase